MQAAEAGFAAIAEKDDLCAFDEATCLKIEALFAVLEGQLNAVTNERLPRQQGVFGGAMHGAESVDEANAGGVAPDQNGRAGHQIDFDTLAPDHPFILARLIFDHALKVFEPQRWVCQSMGKIEDRVIRLLPVDAVEVHHAFFRQMVKHHGAGLVHRGQLGRITEQQECREDLFEVFKLFVIQHGGFIDKADVERFLPAFPAGDEVRAAQAGCRQGAGDGFVRCIESGGAV